MPLQVIITTTLTLNVSLLNSQSTLVAFSDGLGSTVLLHQPVQWRAQRPEVILRAVHIHHRLSPHADSWVRHYESVCMQWQASLVAERVHLEGDGLGIKAQVRRARYRAFAQTLLPDEALMAAQHLDSQCETFLLAPRHSSGSAGLSAMGENIPFAGTQLIRLLLVQTRKMLETWAQQHELCWTEDESDRDGTYNCNLFRLCITPLLQQRWPYFV